jgi:hypothetical protein
MGVGARQIYAMFRNITIFRNVLRLAWNVIFDVAKKLMSVCYGSTLKKRATCSSIYLVHVCLTAGLSSQKTGLYIHPPWNLQSPSYKPKWKDSFWKWINGSCTVDVKEADYLVEWCGRGKGPVVGFCDNCDGFYGCITLVNYHSLRDRTLCSLLFGRLARICTKVYVHFKHFNVELMHTTLKP